eukprot:TRINITY_DN3097_c0_g1_i11.p1 TRINITY_DN3097_c0_g1~~TRINITY_DN3097_c0_g1_i11.p1  ORF type:complete len:306 (+),score=70.39 TRINITY_DN3097_c0_g1_i11:743-1660(+)
MVYHKVAIVGATGNLGPTIVDALLQHKFEVTAVTFNNPEDPKYNDLKSKGVKVVHANIDDKFTLVRAFHGIDAVVSTVGGALFSKQTVIIDAAVEAGVKRFLPSEFGGSTRDKLVRSEEVLQPKIQIIEYLEKVASQGKITWTGIATGPFFDWGLQVGFLQFDLKNESVTLYDEGKAKFVTSNTRDIGLWVALTLLHPERTENKYLELGTFKVNQLEILEALEKVSGKKWTVKEHKTTVEAQELAKKASEKLKQGDETQLLPFFMQSLFVIIFRGLGAYEIKETELFPEYKPLSLEESVRLVLNK